MTAPESFLTNHPDVRHIEVLMPDMNGILRCKRVPKEELGALFGDGLNACGSVSFCNSRGDIPESLVLGTRDGDPDMRIRAVPGTLAPVPWLESPTAQVLASFWQLDGSPSDYDPRHALERATTRLLELGVSVKLALEMELYLLTPGGGGEPARHLVPAPGSTITPGGAQYSSANDLWQHDGFLDAVARFADTQGVPASTVHSEFCAGQYEINLHHVDDPMKACDQAALLKRLIRGAAHAHNLGTTFMAKPFADAQGSGMHVHVSLFDKTGENLFADPDKGAIPPTSATLRHAVGGLHALMNESMAIFAPNANSYRRLQPGTFVPLKPNWGYNHRGVAVRIPVSDPENLRVEHRVAGADANPYLLVAAVFAGIHYGITHELEPGKMIAEHTVLDEEEATLPTHWEDALERFSESRVLPAYLGERFSEVYAKVRQEECQAFRREVTNRDYEWYLGSV